MTATRTWDPPMYRSADPMSSSCSVRVVQMQEDLQLVRLAAAAGATPTTLGATSATSTTLAALATAAASVS